jgi:hypothetical protein
VQRLLQRSLIERNAGVLADAAEEVIECRAAADNQ